MVLGEPVLGNVQVIFPPRPGPSCTQLEDRLPEGSIWLLDCPGLLPLCSPFRKVVALGERACQSAPKSSGPGPPLLFPLPYQALVGHTAAVCTDQFRPAASDPHRRNSFSVRPSPSCDRKAWALRWQVKSVRVSPSPAICLNCDSLLPRCHCQKAEAFA